jgi:Protein of unknown function (DUF2752)
VNASLRRGAETAARVAAPPGVVALAAFVLLRFPPGQNHFYPLCPVYEFLHVQCPGCGATRALAALLRGRLHEALELNALITLAVPFAVAYGIFWYWRFVRREEVRWPRFSPVGLVGAMVLAVGFAIVRNLPLQGFR